MGNLSQKILVFVKQNIFFKVSPRQFIYNKDNYTIGEAVTDPIAGGRVMKNCKFLLLLVLMLLALSVCALAADPVYLDGTGATAGAYTDLKSAVDALPDDGGTVIVCGETAMATGSALVLPEKSGKVTIKCADGTKFKFKLAYSMKLGSETEFDNIELVCANNSWGAILACGHKLTMGEGVTTSIENKNNRAISVYGGNTGNVTTDYDSHLVIKGGEWRMIFGGNHTGTFNGDSTVELSNVTITNKLSAKCESGTFNGSATLVADLRGGKTVTSAAYLEMPTFLVDDGYTYALTGDTYAQVKASATVTTVYLDGTGKTEGAYKTFEDALSALPNNGGTVILVGDTTVGTAGTAINLPAKGGKVTVTSENCAKFIIARTAIFNCEIEFDNVDLCTSNASWGFVYANGHKITINENVKTSIANTAGKYLDIFGGRSSVDNSGLNTHLVIRSGTYANICGGGYNADFSGTSKVELSGVTVQGTVTAQMRNPDYIFTGTSEIILDLRGNKTVSAGSFREAPTCLVDNGYEAVCYGSMYFQWKAGQETLDTVYVRDGGTGDGASATAPIGSLAVAYALLGEDGGEIVLVGDTSVYGGVTFPECTGSVTFKAQKDAKLVLNGSIALSKNTNGAAVTFDLPIAATDSVIYGGFRNVTFTENCAVTGTLDYYGGMLSANEAARVDNATVITELPYTITVKNGTFRTFAGGIRRNSAKNMVGSVAAPLTVNISGGSFTENFSLSGGSILADDVTLTVSGGDFACPVYVRYAEYHSWTEAFRSSSKVAASADYYAADGDIAIDISGGNFTGGLIAVHDSAVTYTQVFRGNFTLTIGEDASFADGTVLDATQVKAYAGENKTASLVCPDASVFTVKRFDFVNGTDMTDTFAEPLRIVFIGDSITQGVGASNTLTKSYPAVFASLAKENGKEVIVANYGMGAAGASGINNVYYRDKSFLAYPLLLSETDADYYVLALGTNDHRAALYNGNYVKHIEEYTAMVNDLSALPDTKKIFISNPIMIGLTDEHDHAMLLTSVTMQSLERMAEAFAKEDADKYVFIDMFALSMPEEDPRELVSSDACHPNDAGYVTMGNVMYNAIFNGVTRPETDYHKTDIYVSEAGTQFAAGTAEDPTSRMDMAMAMIPAGAEATVHIQGTVTYGMDFVTASQPAKLTFVGEGEDAELQVGCEFFLVHSDVKFDNLTLSTTASSTMLFANYHDVEMTESVVLSGNWSFYAGHRVYATPYDTEASASSDNDCTITLSGSGAFENFVLGNLRRKNAAFIGTYSGNLTATIGDAYTAVGGTVGAVGQNYLTGSVTVSAPFEMAEYAAIGTVSDPIVYDKSKNTGTVSITYTGEERPDTVYVDGTGATVGAYTTIEAAIAALPAAGGTVILAGDTAMAAGSALVLPEKSGKVTIKCADGTKFKFKLAYSLKLGSDMEFDNIELVNANNSWGAILACGHELTMGTGVTTSIENRNNRAIAIYGGDTGSVTTDYDSHIVLKGGTWRSVYGGHHTGTFGGNSTVEVSNVTITHKLSAKCESGAFNGEEANLIADLRGGKPVTAATYLETPTFRVDAGYEAVLSGTTYKQEKLAVAGDVNGDTKVTVADALLILKAILNDTALENADVSGDGALSLADVMRVLKSVTL